MGSIRVRPTRRHDFLADAARSARAGFPSFIGGAPRAREAKRDQDQVIDIRRFRARKQVITGLREGNGNARHQRALEQTRPAYRFTICSVQGAEPARWPREARTRGRPQDAAVPREAQAAIFSKRIPSPSHLLLPRAHGGGNEGLVTLWGARSGRRRRRRRTGSGRRSHGRRRPGSGRARRARLPASTESSAAGGNWSAACR